MRTLVAALIVAASVSALAAPPPYDESADAKAQIQAALGQARKAGVPVLVVFGANWCPDCKLLDMAFKSGTSAPLIDKSFMVVKVNVGRFDHNVDIADAYGVPLKKGIPAVAILNADGKVTYATRAGELADARNMGESGIYDFFVKAAARGS
jgi:protein disulfide-isomerase